MPESNDIELCTKEFLQQELRSGSKNLIILDCRSSYEYLLNHIRSSVNFSIPTIILRRLSAGKIDLLSTIKSKDLRNKIEKNYKINLFILYNNNDINIIDDKQLQQNQQQQQQVICLNNQNNQNAIESMNQQQQQQQQNGSTSLINVLYRRLKQDGCRVVCLQDGYTNFRDSYPEWCEEGSQDVNETSRNTMPQADQQLMGLRSLRISTPHSDSACSSSAESSDCESAAITYNQFNEAPVEIISDLFLGNASHSKDSRQLQKYNIKYILNVTPDLPNVFESTGDIKYLQIPITDHFSQDLAVHFPIAIQFIEEARSNHLGVLVHCLAGVSRSVTVTLAYLMSTKSLCLNDAFNLVRDRKPDVSPNFHFMEQLYSFERQLKLQCNSSQIPSTSSTDLNKPLMLNDSEMFLPPKQSKYICHNIESDCKCMMDTAVDFLATSTVSGHHHHHHQHHNQSIVLKATGVSPDSGIEFDRWTPSTDKHQQSSAGGSSADADPSSQATEISVFEAGKDNIEQDN